MSGDTHKDLARRAIPWIRSRSTGRGIQCGHEVPVAPSYVADTVVLCGLQNQFRKRYAPDRGLERDDDGVRVLPEFACIFEAKATREDFLKTFGDLTSNRFTYVGSLHWIVVPDVNIITETHIGHWGVLVRSAGGLREALEPTYLSRPFRDICHIAYHLLWHGKEWPG